MILRSKAHLGLPFELPFKLERQHLLIFLVVFFIVLFTYDQSRPPTIIKTAGAGGAMADLDGGDTIGNNTGHNDHNGGAPEINYTSSYRSNDTPNDTSNNTSTNNTGNTSTNNTVRIIYPNPENTTEEVLVLNNSENLSDTNATSNTHDDANEESDETPVGENGAEKPGEDVEVTYYFFWADYCSTCKTMMPWIEDVADDHPKLKVKMIDLYSGSQYIQRFQVASTAVSVIVKSIDGEDVSGTKMVGFLDRDAIERLVCTELDDTVCNKKYPDL